MRPVRAALIQERQNRQCFAVAIACLATDLRITSRCRARHRSAGAQSACPPVSVVVRQVPAAWLLGWLLGRDEVPADNRGVLTYVRWYWPDDDVWNYEELDADRRAAGHVEVRGQDGVIATAAALAEVLAARDDGGIEAVQRYEATYGVVPEGPFPVDPTDYPLEPVTADEFEAFWNSGRTQPFRLDHQPSD